ncbi:Cytochrome C oxidase, cbb3-type, subunit III [Tistlia consotensis]|uniref:Cytochrome C oxidase, cbb3-type, subunit III n=1 Tax=Tistlia consotensis USBA 355 TaxID=560819 RepID=A0A1Y6BX03_9PROT|nr:cytochrome c [Tistlia consotensis]SMF22458.1 Cytochrome C oxidase, cbb3-type, subunit III [Tistlia consotensis USBA 355]SNR45934.1 Cytochrome C oxidase, cbb3-type, subunit III [Tistlia consotensis]
MADRPTPRKTANRRLTLLHLAGGLLAVIAVVALLLAVFWEDENAEAAIRLRPDDAALVAEGKALYATHCASCHGAGLEGEADWQQRKADGRLPAPPQDETGHTWHHPDAQLFALTKHGPAALVGGGYKSAMPAFEGVLSDREIVAVLSFIKSRWPEEIRRRHDALNEAAAAR